jgi:hypothetical protein
MFGLTLGGRPATGDHFSTTTPHTLPRVSHEEAQFYYAGLPSRPLLVARTGATPYETPTGLEAYPRQKELRVMGDHKIKELSGIVILWIGVKPDSLSYEQGIDVALQCKRLLLDYDINDADVEIRQSEVIRSAGPQLLEPTRDSER